MTAGVAHIYQKEFLPLAEALLNSSEPITLFEDYRHKSLPIRSQYEINPLRESLIAAIGECLNHEDYKISANAARVLRQNMILCQRTCDLNAIISDLSEQVNDRRIQPASEGSLSLAFFLSTRPKDRELPQWGGSDPMAGGTMDKDLDQYQFIRAPVDSGYLHRVSPEMVETAIDSLIQNLNRKEYKRSSEWKVAKESAKALGVIGYQRPALVEEAVPEIYKLLRASDERQAWLIYALTSIGYSRPDLIPKGFESRLKQFAEEAGFGVGWQLNAAVSVGHRKIGHAPINLEIVGSKPGSDLSEVTEKLFNFMLGRYPSAPEEWIQAFVEIYLSRPTALVDILRDELDRHLQGNTRGFDFPDNFMLLLKELAGVDATRLQPLIGTSEEFYEEHAQSHYWYENALEFYRRIGSENEDLLPDTLANTVKEFLESENRHSVLTHGRSFLQEVGQWDDDLFSTEVESTELLTETYDLSDIEEQE